MLNGSTTLIGAFLAALSALASGACSEPATGGSADSAAQHAGGGETTAFDSGTDALWDVAGDLSAEVGPDADAPEVLPQPPSPGQATFAMDRVIEVAVTLPSPQWDALRAQGRTVYDILPPDCLEAPVTKPFTWFEADVTINGTSVPSVGVRKKGFLGSLDNFRPSLKLRFDQFVDGQRFDGLKRMTLNNNRQDASRLNTCLAYDVMRMAGVPTPRCNYAHVTVNGVSLGVYSHVDSMKRPFLRQHFANDEGTLYESQLADLREGWTGNLENKTVDDAGPGPEIFAVVDVLENVADSELLASLSPLVDLTAFVRFWAAEVLVAHWDGFAGNLNNSYIYHDPTSDQLHFLPWGPDAAFQGNRDLFSGSPVPKSVMAQALLTRRLYADPSVRGQYVAELERQLEQAWDENWLSAAVESRRALIAPFVLADNAAFEEDVTRLQDFVSNRRAGIDAELAAGPPEWVIGLRDSPCWSATGSATATGQTTYNSLGQSNIFAAGTGTLTVLAPGIPADILQVGSKGGPADAATRTTLQVAGTRADGSFFLIVVEAPTASLSAGAYLPFDLSTTDGYLASLSSTFELEIVGRFYTGGLTIDAYDGVDGNPLEFSVNGDLYGPSPIADLVF